MTPLGGQAPGPDDPGWMGRVSSKLGATDAVMNVSGSVVLGLYVLGLTAYLYTSAGPSAFGVWVSVSAVIAPLSVLDAGLTLAVTRSTAARVAGERESVHELAAAVSLYVILGLVAWVAAVVLTTIPIVTLTRSGESVIATFAVGFFLGLDVAVGLVTTPWLSALRGLRRFRSVLIGSVVQVAVAIPLTLTLFALFGLPGAAMAQAAARVAGRTVIGIALRGSARWFPMRPRIPRRAFVRRVLSFSSPLIVIAVASQVSFASDILVVGAFAGSLAASAFAIGAKLPALALSFVQQALDVFFPSFVAGATTGNATKGATADRALRLAGLMGGAVFFFLILARDPVLVLWVGPVDPLASQVLLVYSLAWCLHTPAHVIALLLVASGRHRQLAPITGLESILNLALSIILVLTIGPIGAAIGSLVAVAISNLILVPALGHRQVGLPTTFSVREIVAGGALGLAIAVAAYALPVLAVEPGRLRLAVQCMVGASLGGAAVYWLWPGISSAGQSSRVD